MKEYIEKLVESLFKSYNIEKEKIQLIYNIDDLKLDIETVIPLGLILNELIANALKYAFSNSENGALKVVLQQNDDTLFLEVSDNGSGMPEGWDITQNKSLGFQIIQSFTDKLKAELSVISDNGTCVRIIITNPKDIV
jgi:two-component sensor histidine kinase